MPDSGFILSPTGRVVDVDGRTIPGGTIECYLAGTSTPKIVYSDVGLTVALGATVYLDSGGHPVASQGSSTKVLIYTGSDLIKLVVKDANGVTVATYDNVQCVQDTSRLGTSTGGSGMVSSIVSKTTDYSVTPDDDAKLLNCNPTSAAFKITLPSAIDVGDGFEIGIRHAGTTTTNTVQFTTVSNQTVALDGATSHGGALTGGGEEIWLVSNGGGWVGMAHVPPRIVGDVSVFTVAARLSSTPASHTAGAYYLINATPTGDWASLGFAANDIVRATGQGGWSRFSPTPDCGWLAYVKAENLFTAYMDTTWTDLDNATANPSSALQVLQVEDRQVSGTGGEAAVAGVGSVTRKRLNTVGQNTIPGASLDSSSYKFTLPAGTYAIWGMCGALMLSGGAAGGIQYVLRNSATSVGLAKSPVKLLRHDVSTGGNVPDSIQTTLFGYVSVDAATEFELVYTCTATNVYLGQAFSIGATEVHASVLAVKIDAMQGPRGVPGPTGTSGSDPGMRWTFDTTTTSEDPTVGKLRLNNAALGSVTAAYYSVSNAETGNPSVLDWLLSFDDSGNVVTKGTLILRSINDPKNYLIAEVTGTITNNTSWVSIPLTVVNQNGSFAAGSTISTQFYRSGEPGTVNSVFGRSSSAITAQSGDYTTALVTHTNRISQTGPTKATLDQARLPLSAAINTDVMAISATATDAELNVAATLSASLTIPSTMALRIGNGGKITKASTYTLTIDGPFEAPPVQVFYGFSSGDVTFGANAIDYVRPEWFGDTATDATNAINYAIAALPANKGKAVRLQNGKNYPTTAVISIAKGGVGIDTDGGMGVATITSASASADILSIAGSSLASQINYNFVRRILLNRSTTPTASAVGLKLQYTVNTHVEEVVSAESVSCYWLSGTSNAKFTRCKSVVSLGSSGSRYGWKFDGTDPNASAVVAHCEAIDSGFTGTSYGSFHSGTSIKDCFFDAFETAGMDVGTFVQGSGSEDFDIHFRNCIHDLFKIAGFWFMDCTGTISVLGGWTNPYATGAQTHGVYNDNSTGLSVVGHQFFGGSNYAFHKGLSLDNSSSMATATGCLFKGCLYGIYANGGSLLTLSGSSFHNISGQTATAHIALVSATRCSVTSNAFSGYATTGISSTGDNCVVSANSLDPTNITTPYSVSGTNSFKFDVNNALTIAQGGTSATSTSEARAALGLDIGIDVQAYNAAILGAWTAFTPSTPTSGSGSFTSVSAAGRYRQVGKTVEFFIAVTITTNGTAATTAIVNLPVAARSSNFTFKGRENQITGNSLKAYMNSTSSLTIQNEDNTYPGADGRVLALSGIYEAA